MTMIYPQLIVRSEGFKILLKEPQTKGNTNSIILFETNFNTAVLRMMTQVIYILYILP